MIQQVPIVLLYNMIYISKKEEFLIIIKPCEKNKPWGSIWGILLETVAGGKGGVDRLWGKRSWWWWGAAFSCAREGGLWA